MRACTRYAARGVWPVRGLALAVAARDSTHTCLLSAASTRQLSAGAPRPARSPDEGVHQGNPASKASSPSAGLGSKISLMFMVGDGPGSLSKILELFQLHGVNLSRIESRPCKRWVPAARLERAGTGSTRRAGLTQTAHPSCRSRKYEFTVDCEGDPAEANVSQACGWGGEGCARG